MGKALGFVFIVISFVSWIFYWTLSGFGLGLAVLVSVVISGIICANDIDNWRTNTRGSLG